MITKGSKVLITEGKHKDLIGTVVDCAKYHFDVEIFSGCLNQHSVRLPITFIKELPKEMIAERFEIGDKVAVINGKHSGEKGVVEETRYGFEFCLKLKLSDGSDWFKQEDVLPFAKLEEVPDDVVRFRELCRKMSDTYAAKNKAYGNSFHKSYEKYGAYASIVRMSDKWNRLENLALNKVDDNGESIKDTLLDLANYAIMYYMEIDK